MDEQYDVIMGVLVAMFVALLVLAVWGAMLGEGM